MVLHRALGERQVADEQIALVDRPTRRRERGAGDGEVGAREVHQRLGHGADVAFVGRVEGRAIFEEQLLGARRAQRLRGGEREAHGLRLGNCSRLQRDHDRLGVAEPAPFRQGPDDLHGPHALTGDHQRQIGGPRQIVRDGAQ